MDNKILSANPTMPRSISTLSHGDVSHFFHGLPFDSKRLAAGRKLFRQGDLNEVMTTTLGISPSDSLSSSLNTKQLPASLLEEVKRVNTSLHESFVRTRDRVKLLIETSSKFDKCFHNIPTRKRFRSDFPSSDRANSLTELAGFGGIAKTRTKTQASGVDTESPKLEEKTRSVVPNKRTRTSLSEVDGCGSAHPRSHGSLVRDRDVLALDKDQAVSYGIEGWEKSRMKKKRSRIKSETSAVLSRSLDGNQEPKCEIRQRLGADVRSRSNAHGFRSGASDGVRKLDVCSQKAGPGMRSTPKNDLNIDIRLNDQTDHLVGSDKEKVNIKAFNRSSNCENNSSCSPNSIRKLNKVTRARRSNSRAIPKASSNVNQSAGNADEWDPSQSSSKLLSVAGANNHKRTPSARSSSPPLAQWADQRHQKIPRVARRSNIVRPVLNYDEQPTLDTVANTSGKDNELGLKRRAFGSGILQYKLKCDNLSSAALSESEESEAAEAKSNDMNWKPCEMGERGEQNVPEVATLVLPSRRNKLLDEEHVLGVGVRRQGRTVRGYASSTRIVNPVLVEKGENAVTSKKLRSSRLGTDKNESKTGCPPSMKPSDRRGYTRPRHSINAGGSDFCGQSDDMHEELLAAANAAMSSAGQACPSTFWRQMEPVFGLVSYEDIAYVKQMGDSFSLPTPSFACVDDSNKLADGYEVIEYEENQCFTNETKSGEHFPEQPVSGSSEPSLFQRLLSAFIIEEGDEAIYSRGKDDFEFDIYESRFEPDVELKCDSWNQMSLGNIQTVGRPASNGYRITATRRYLDEPESDDFESADITADRNLEANVNSSQPADAMMPGIDCTHSEYSQMTIHERLLTEVRSIGIFSEPVSGLSIGENDEISAEISMLENKLRGQVLNIKQYLCKLEKSVTEARETQEREIERLAFEKLVTMAYEKYMSCWGPNASCGKGMGGKIARQAALTLVNRTIEQCHKFENTNESCFDEAVFRDVFQSVSSLVKNAESTINNEEGDSSKLYSDTQIPSSEVTVSATLGSHPLILQSGKNMDSHEKYSSEDFQALNHLSEQIGKGDATSNRMRKRELLLHEVVGGTVGTSPRAPSGIRSSLLSGAKGKRSERDREGKEHRDILPVNGTAKIGQPSLGIAKGDRKSKAKPKQRTTQLSASVNGILGKISDTPKENSLPVQESHETITNQNSKKNDLCLDKLSDPKALDISNLEVPELDVLGVADDLGEQGQDLASWLNIDEDGLQDLDFMGLEIPMDDLSELNMMV